MLTLLLQDTAAQPPDTRRYMIAAYLVIGLILTAYYLFLWSRGRRAEEE
jgi:hypothetical protein